MLTLIQAFGVDSTEVDLPGCEVFKIISYGILVSSESHTPYPKNPTIRVKEIFLTPLEMGLTNREKKLLLTLIQMHLEWMAPKLICQDVRYLEIPDQLWPHSTIFCYALNSRKILKLAFSKT